MNDKIPVKMCAKSRVRKTEVKRKFYNDWGGPVNLIILKKGLIIKTVSVLDKEGKWSKFVHVQNERYSARHRKYYKDYNSHYDFIIKNNNINNYY